MTRRTTAGTSPTCSPGTPDVEVVGKAADGEEALRLASLLKPDVITLDLEMPRMDGFTFLRILMAKQPTPVIVVSSYSQKENVFKALELGALDFVTKPDRQISPDATELREQILQKVLLVRSLRPTFTPPVVRRQRSGAWGADGSRAASTGGRAPGRVRRAEARRLHRELHGGAERAARDLRQAARRRRPPRSSSRSTCPTSSRAPSPSGSTSAVRCA